MSTDRPEDHRADDNHTADDHTADDHTADHHAEQVDVVEPLSHDTISGEADYVATNAGGFGAERGNPLPEDEQGRGTEYDPVDDGPQREGQGG